MWTYDLTWLLVRVVLAIAASVLAVVLIADYVWPLVHGRDEGVSDD